jgi:hypothetical protein
MTNSEGHAKAMRDNLHPCDIGLWIRMIPIAQEAARIHKLPLQEMWPDCKGDRLGWETGMSCYGCCDVRAGRIHVVLRFKHPKTGDWMAARPEGDVWRTLAHELAHLEEASHRPRFWAVMAGIVATVESLRWKMQEVPMKTPGRVFALPEGI